MRALGLLCLVTPLTISAADAPPAAQLYNKLCAGCHESGAQRVPTRAALSQMRGATILKALEIGAMRQQGSLMSQVERRAVAYWLGGKNLAASDPDQLVNRCASSPQLPLSTNAPSWSDWGAGPSNLRFQTSGFQAADLPRLKLKWSFGLQNATSVRSQPAVYGNRIFIGNQDGTVYALDTSSGCVHWATSAAAQVRSGITVGVVKGRVQTFFGDSAGQVYSVDASTGAPLWHVLADEHPAAMVTSTPALHNGILYVGVSSYEEASATSPGFVCCTFRGSVIALDASTGKQLWKTYTVDQPAKPGKPTKRGAKTMGPSGVGVWSAPTLDPENGLLYVTTGDNYSDPPTLSSDAVLALRLDTGKLAWSKQLTANDAYNSSCPLEDKINCPDSDGPDYDFGSSSILVKTATRRLLLLPQKSGMMHAIDPDKQGEIVWSSRAGQGGVLGGLQWGSASDGTRVFAPISDMRFTRTRIPGSNDIRRTIDPEHGGGIVAFRVDNGERLWHTPAPGCGDRRPCSPSQSSAASGISGAVFSGSEDGHMRAYSTTDGKILWDFDTARDFQTVNGVAGRGGAIDGGGPVIAGDMLFVGSGYAQWGGMAGNVLLAFGLEKK